MKQGGKKINLTKFFILLKEQAESAEMFKDLTYVFTSFYDPITQMWNATMSYDWKKTDCLDVLTEYLS